MLNYPLIYEHNKIVYAHIIAHFCLFVKSQWIQQEDRAVYSMCFTKLGTLTSPHMLSVSVPYWGQAGRLKREVAPVKVAQKVVLCYRFPLPVI